MYDLYVSITIFSTVFLIGVEFSLLLLVCKAFDFSVKSEWDLCCIVLAVGFLPFITLHISCYSLLAGRVSAEKSADSRMGTPLYVSFCFSTAAFNSFSLYLIFISLIIMCLGMFLLSCMGLYTSWILVSLSSPMLGKFSTIISSHIFSDPFSFFSGTPIIQMLVHLI